VEEETAELKEAIDLGDKTKKEEEFGDLMFALVNYARFLEIDPETALERTNIKFIRRFKYIEEQAGVQNRNLKEMTLGEMDNIWNEAKAKGL
jgi:XTP/dITP diphosphohydrolase